MDYDEKDRVERNAFLTGLIGGSLATETMSKAETWSGVWWLGALYMAGLLLMFFFWAPMSRYVREVKARRKRAGM